MTASAKPTRATDGRAARGWEGDAARPPRRRRSEHQRRERGGGGGLDPDLLPHDLEGAANGAQRPDRGESVPGGLRERDPGQGEREPSRAREEREDEAATL